MKHFLYLFLFSALAAFCRADELSVADSPDWHPMSEAQTSAIRSHLPHLPQKEVQLVDGSVQVGGGATLMAIPYEDPVNKASVNYHLGQLIKGMEHSGSKVSDRQPASIGPLRGVSFIFQTQVGTRQFAGVDYVVFTNRAMYVISVFGSPGLTREDPLVTSYLSRVKIAPEAQPGDIDRPGAFSPVMLNSNQIAYLIGSLMPYAVVTVVAVIILIRAFKK